MLRRRPDRIRVSFYVTVSRVKVVCVSFYRRREGYRQKRHAETGCHLSWSVSSRGLEYRESRINEVYIESLTEVIDLDAVGHDVREHWCQSLFPRPATVPVIDTEIIRMHRLVSTYPALLVSEFPIVVVGTVNAFMRPTVRF